MSGIGSARNGKLYETERQLKILEHSEDNITVKRKKFNRRNGTMIPMHLRNCNGVPVRSVPVHFKPWV